MSKKSNSPASARQGNKAKTSAIVAVDSAAQNSAPNSAGVDTMAPPPGEPLRNVRHERYAALVVALGSQRNAYAQAYGRAVSPAVDDEAPTLAAQPHVRARINDYRSLAIAISTRSLEERIAELAEQIDGRLASSGRPWTMRASIRRWRLDLSATEMKKPARVRRCVDAIRTDTERGAA